MTSVNSGGLSGLDGVGYGRQRGGVELGLGGGVSENGVERGRISELGSVGLVESPGHGTGGEVDAGGGIGFGDRGMGRERERERKDLL